MAKMRVRARAVDMLGRQQIAGIPTAIHELFKNAHDAYADRVDVDFFRTDELFILRDDGIGMTREDFEDKWLTLGTESKVNANREPGFIPEGKSPRAIMGEKGIGRLAIATIGKQALVMTRALRQEGLSSLTVALVHWGLFEIPGIDLDEIDIPIAEVEGGSLPDAILLSELKEVIRKNVESLSDKIPMETQENIFHDLSRLEFDPSVIAPKLQGPSLLEDGYGTHFFILPTDPIIENDIDSSGEDDASNIQKMLLGFSNTMFADSHPLMATAFRDHGYDSSVTEMIGGEAFFTPEEFDLVDHHIEGSFDEFGQFQGTVSVYHQEPTQHVIHWSGGHGSPTECGPFKIKFAYLQGNPADSIVPGDRFGSIFSKTNKIGGLYIYRDGIRILPYGRADYDFLEIERRRNLAAKDWFFAYRRFFGAIEINHETSPHLIEKAGREGFRENRAYRQFREILMNFLKQLAIDFFRESSDYTEYFEHKTELRKQAELLKQRAKLVSKRKKAFEKEIKKFFENLEKNRFVEECNKILETTKRDAEALRALPDPNRAVEQLLKLESSTREKVKALRRSMTITRPRGVGFGKKVLSDWDAYQKNRLKLEEDLVVPLERELDGLISELNEAHIGVNRRLRIAHQLNDEKKTVQRRSSELKRSVNEQLQLFQSGLQETLQHKLLSLNGAVEHVLVDFERTDASSITEDQLVERQRSWEMNIEDAMGEADEYLSSLRDQLKDLTNSLKGGELLGSDTLEAVEGRSEAYKEQLDRYFEFAQVGMSIGIVQHEFSATVKRIRDCIKALKPWAEGTPDLEPLYGDMRHNFEHLDSYLDLFTPLNRRLYRKARDLSGLEVLRYLQDVFGERLDRHEIKLKHTPEFDNHVVNAFPSTILPVFVNLLDNAIYWITTDHSSEKLIRLDADERGFLIWNGGPGIEHRDENRIFDFGITRKPGGRGMGLYISRESLIRDGFNLVLLEAGESTHPVFLIRSAISEERGEATDVDGTGDEE